MNGIDGIAGEFVYLGLEKQLNKHILPDFHYSSDIFLQFNVDGMKLYNSSSKQFWLILCKVTCKSNIYSPFCVAIYNGNSKPANNFDFFNKFVQKINLLMSKELIIDGKTFKL